MSPLSILAKFFLLLFALSFLTLPLEATLQNNYTFESFQIGRLYFFSADAPITTAAGQLQPVVDAADLILSHFARVENATIASLNSGKTAAPNDVVRPCNHVEPQWARSANFKFGPRGWPLVDGSCISDTFGTVLTPGELPPYSIDDLYEALFKRGKAIKDNIKPIMRTFENNFTDPDFLYNCPYATQSQKCVLHPAAGFRVGNNWYISHGITNAPKNAQLGLMKRQGLTEYTRVVDGKLNDHLLMCLQVRPEKGETPVNRTDATTIITTFRGAANPSFIRRLYIDENPAVLRSLDESDLFIQQAEDALTFSNIAILVLPLALNLVPIALLAEVSTVTMLLYTLMSDVLTVIPLGIKGIELIIIGSQRHRTVMVRMTTSSNGTRPESAAAEIHAAECRANENIRPTGIAFLVLSIAFLVAGIAAEFVARHYAMKRRTHRIAELKEASSMLSSKGSSKSAGLASKRPSPPASLASIDCHPRGTIGSPFHTQSYHESYSNTKGGKNA